MTLISRTIKAMPWRPWAPVTAAVALVAWSAGSYPPDFPSRHLYLRAGLMVIGVGLAFILDDPAAETTDPAPSPLRQRRAIRVIAGLSVWLGLATGLFLLGARDMDVVFVYDPEMDAALPVGRLLLEGVTMAACGLAIAAIISKRWDDEPGKIASASLLVLYAASWAVPERWKPWASPNDDRWTTGYPWWWAALALAALVLIAASWDARVGWSTRRLTRGAAGPAPLALGPESKKRSTGVGVD
jgi:hypothetical protein